MFLIFGLVDLFVIGIAVEPQSTIKGNVESLLELTPWNWKHLNTSLKMDSPVTVDVSLTSHYRLTRKHLNKILRLEKQRDCASILRSIPNIKGRDGVYTIYPDMKTKKLVYCDMTTDGGGWTSLFLILQFHNKFQLKLEWSCRLARWPIKLVYFLGNEDIHFLTSRTKQEIRVDLQKFSGEKAYAKYSTFTVGSESQKYKLTVGGYSGTAGNSLAAHNGMKFTTKDQDNDTWNKNCGVNFQGGWWFKDCISAFLNGPYKKSAKIAWDSIMWYDFGKENRALKKATMMIRSKI
uniref:Fibrinogen C-terminal domain-containing protein n=1 Tax=Magallana gigas TaxID=29159 RepID=A0A8W8ISS0_MAGGI